MLIRRFAIVCLLIALFGAGLSAAVTQAQRMADQRPNGVLVPCSFDDRPACLQPQHGRG
ncbi:hypothetical protein [Mesorhizobium xinjiangense]|uniref:hypothetical protein n=1 Tax=Mesorhizobium xinjiangense TaxID=2678685 RepID=UPI0012EE4063|nr:hypothetical protein [Mesorhizobium xinjiangense]